MGISTSLSKPAFRSQTFDAGLLGHPTAFGTLSGRPVRYSYRPDPANAAPAPSPETVSPVQRRFTVLPGLAFERLLPASGAIELNMPVHTLVLYSPGRTMSGQKAQPVSGSDLSQRLTFIPAGEKCRGWQASETETSSFILQFEPDAFPEIRSASASPLQPRLFFQNAILRDIAAKVTDALNGPSSASSAYIEALGVILVHELAAAVAQPQPDSGLARGGLAPWQQREVANYIEAHLSERIPLSDLASRARLSRFHFCRAFKQSFGVSPHRYHTLRRIERAKALLAERTHSVTEIGFAVGFSETSSFSTAFRRATALTPTAYQRTAG